MVRSLLLLLWCILTVYKSTSQSVSYSCIYDSTDAEIQEAVAFHTRYLNDFIRDTIPDPAKYWSDKDLARFKQPDQMIYAISSEYPTYSMRTAINILSIQPQKEYIQIKTLLGWTDSLQQITTLCITNHYVAKDKNGRLYYINPLDINTKDWGETTIRNITFHYPPYHTFNRQKADSLIAHVKQLEKEWGLKPIPIQYYFADTREETLKARGFDYTLDMSGRPKPSGISDDRDNVVYCGGLGENYFHEVVHIYLNRLFPESPLREGLANMYGGSMGKPLAWHMGRMNSYLQQHPDADPVNLSYMDNYTNPGSTIRGVLCRRTYHKEGLAGLKRIMSYTSMDELMQKEYDADIAHQGALLRKLIAEQ